MSTGGSSVHATMHGTSDRTRHAVARIALVRAVGESELVVTEMKDVAFIDALVVDAHALVVDAVRRAEVLDVERPVATDHGGVLARDVAVLDRKVGRLAAATDDELVLGHRIPLTVVDEKQRGTRAAHLRR